MWNYECVSNNLPNWEQGIWTRTLGIFFLSFCEDYLVYFIFFYYYYFSYIVFYIKVLVDFGYYKRVNGGRRHLRTARSERETSVVSRLPWNKEIYFDMGRLLTSNLHKLEDWRTQSLQTLLGTRPGSPTPPGCQGTATTSPSPWCSSVSTW